MDVGEDIDQMTLSTGHVTQPTVTLCVVISKVIGWQSNVQSLASLSVCVRVFACRWQRLCVKSSFFSFLFELVCLFVCLFLSVVSD